VKVGERKQEPPGYSQQPNYRPVLVRAIAERDMLKKSYADRSQMARAEEEIRSPRSEESEEQEEGEEVPGEEEAEASTPAEETIVQE